MIDESALAFLTLPLINDAHDRIKGHIHRTPVMSSHTLDARTGTRLFFKCENFQKVGAFKARGAYNAVLSLPAEASARGVVTHSSGNHGAALALAARDRGIPAFVVMPSNTALVKKRAVERYGARVTYCEPTLEAREADAARIVEQTGASFVHPYNDPVVMAGQGTVALEFLEQVPELDALICPIGGGGHISGVSVGAKSLRPTIRIIGAEPEAADDAFRSFTSQTLVASRDPRTIADGLRSSLGDKTFAVIRSKVDEIVTVSEQEIVAAMREVWEIMKMIIEPSSAVAVAAALKRDSTPRERRIGIIISGGNVDLDQLPWMADKR
jgi:threonine dehydratase